MLKLKSWRKASAAVIRGLQQDPLQGDRPQRHQSSRPFQWTPLHDGIHGHQSGSYTGCLEELKIVLGEEATEWTMIGNEDTITDNKFFKCSWAFWNKTTVKEFVEELI